MASLSGFPLAICLAAELWAYSCLCYKNVDPATPASAYEPTGYGTLDSYSDPYVPNPSSYGKSYGDSYKPSYGNSYGDSYKTPYGNSYADSYKTSYDNSYGDSSPPSYGTSYDSSNPTYKQGPTYPPRTTLYGSTPEPTKPILKPIPRPTRRPTPTPPSSQDLKYCRLSPAANGRTVKSFPPTYYWFVYRYRGNTITISERVQIETKRGMFLLSFSDDISNLQKIGAMRSSVLVDQGGRRDVLAMKVYDRRRTSCFVTDAEYCNLKYTVANKFYDYVFTLRKVTVPFTDSLKYRVTREVSRQELASTYPGVARFCEEASKIYNVEQGEESGSHVRKLRIFDAQGLIEIDVGTSYYY